MHRTEFLTLCHMIYELKVDHGRKEGKIAEALRQSDLWISVKIRIAWFGIRKGKLVVFQEVLQAE